MNTKMLKKIGAVGLSAALVLTMGYGMSLSRPAQAADKTQKAIEHNYNNLVKTPDYSNTTAKEETTYVVMNADGKIASTNVNEWLRNGKGLSKIDDYSTLKDIENTSGNQKFEQEGNDLTWEADGDDIHYTGKTDADLPVKVKVSYFLDGQKMTAKQIAGKSGQAEIRFTYDVKQKETVGADGKSYQMTHPYTMASGLILNNDHFKNITVTNGKSINDGDNSVVLGIAFPGLQENLNLSDTQLDIPDDVVIKADVEDFQLDGTYTAAMSGVLGDTDFSSGDVEDQLNQLKTAMDQLSSASLKLVDGAGKLSDGADQLSSGADKLDNGAGTLADGAETVNGGAGSLLQGANKINNGASALKAGAKKLNNGTAEAKKGMDTLTAGSEKLNTGMKELTTGSSQIMTGIAQLNSGLGQLSEKSSALREASQKIENVIFDTVTQEVNAKLDGTGISINKLTPANYKQELGGISNSAAAAADKKLRGALAQKGVKDAGKQSAILSLAYDQLMAGGNTNPSQDDISQAVLKAAGMAQQAAEVQSAAATYGQQAAQILSSQGQAVTETNIMKVSIVLKLGNGDPAALTDKTIQAEAAQYLTSAAAFQTAAQNADSNTSALAALAVQAAGGAAQQEQLKEAEQTLDSLVAYVKGVEAYTNGVDSAYAGSKKLNAGMGALDAGLADAQKGADQLQAGAEKLDGGMDQLSKGSSSLADGSSTLAKGTSSLAGGAKKLAKGTSSLSKGASKLADGTDELADGASDLADGASTLYDGINKFNREGIQKLVSSLDTSELEELGRRLQAVSEASGRKIFMGGKVSDMEGESRIIFRTAEIGK